MTHCHNQTHVIMSGERWQGCWQLYISACQYYTNQVSRKEVSMKHLDLHDVVVPGLDK